MNQYIFDLGQYQKVELDIVNPTETFKFKLEYYGDASSDSSKLAPQATRIAFFTLVILDEEKLPNLDFGAAIRFIYNDGLFSVSPGSLNWYQLRSDKWRSFPDNSIISTTTKTLSQGFQREDLRPGQTQLGVFGGSAVTFPEDDYDYELYTRYDVTLSAFKSVQNKFSFALPGKNEAFDMEVLGADRAFNFTVSRTTENPHPGASFRSGTNMGLYYLTIQLQGMGKPTYNMVFRYKFDKLRSDVKSGTLSFGYFKNNAYSAFKWEVTSNESSGVISQSASTIDDDMGNPIVLAVLAQSTGSVPSPSSSSPSPATSTSPRGSSSVTKPRDSTGSAPANRGSFVLATLLISMMAMILLL